MNNNVGEINKQKKNYGKAKDPNYNWWTVFAQYVNFRTVNGREPKSTVNNSKDNDESRLYTWVVNQRRLIKNGNMSEEHLAAFVGAGIVEPIAKVKKQKPVKNVKGPYKKYDEWIAEYKAFRDTYGFNPRYASVDERPLHDWMSRQLKEIENGTIRENKYAMLKESGILEPLSVSRNTKPILYSTQSSGVLLDELIANGVTVDETKCQKERKAYTRTDWSHRSFEESLAAYLAFKAEFNRNPKPSNSPEEKRLYNWMYLQTLLIKKGKISLERYNLLKASGVDIPNRGNQSEELINKGYIKESDYTCSAGDAISTREANYIAKVEACKRKFPEYGTPMYTWVQAQFKHYGRHLKDYQRKAWEDAGFNIKPIISDGKNRRESIPQSDKRKINWANRYNQYKSFVEEKGRLPRQTRTDKYEQKLYYWTFSERNAIKCGTRTDEQIEYLAKIGIAA